MKVVVIGGGVIGLSIAYETAKRGRDVVLLEKEKLGRQASWAGAGIMIPANAETAIHPMEQLEALSHEIHEQWASELRDSTGIDNGFRKCGGLYLARTAGEVAALIGASLEWTEREIEFRDLTPQQFDQSFAQYTSSNRPKKAIWVPGESQITNPSHLKALTSACERLNVTMVENCGELFLSQCNNEVSLQTEGGLSFDNEECQFVFTAGPWTESIARMINIPLPMQPVRGQMLLFKLETDKHPGIATGPIVNEGSRYLVPRTDGHVLTGSTIEEVGFDTSTTIEGIEDILSWASSISPQLNRSTLKKTWAGLRPATFDGFPYLGRMGELKNAFVATGHFKGGLHISTATAIVISDLLDGNKPTIDVDALSPNRAADHKFD